MANKQVEFKGDTGTRNIVQVLVQLHRRVEAMKQDLDIGTREIRKVAQQIFAGHDQKKDAPSSVLFHGAQGTKIRVTRQAAFKRPTTEKRDLLRKLLGKLYSTLFQPVVTIKLHGELKDLRRECKQKGVDLDKYLTVEESFSAQENFFELLATLAPSLSSQQQQGLTEFMEANQKADRVSFLQTKSKGAKKHG